MSGLLGGLKPFRHVPTNIREWTTWMRDQDLLSQSEIQALIDVGVASVSNTTTIVQESGVGATAWEFLDFGEDRTLQSSDAGLFLRSTGASATNLTIPSGVFQLGQQVSVIQYGAGTLTVVAGSGVTIRTPTTLAINEQYGTVTLILMTFDEWFIAGRMAP